MLKLHDYECPVCGLVREELVDVPPNVAHVHCPKCRGVMRHIVVGGKAHVFKPFWHPHLDHHPVFIDSWRTYKRELEKRNLSSPLGS